MPTSARDIPAGAAKPPPARIGRYELLRHLATGGMAEIHLARVSGIEGFEKIVVLKRILPQLAANQEFVRLFLNEARVAATLQHPNIAQVYDVGVEAGEYFFAMEFVHGEDVRGILKTAVAQGREVPLEVAITIILGACAGLQHAHEKVDLEGKPIGIIHRDVSPSNILVSYDGGVKLVDFGIAKAQGTQAETQYGNVRGKFSYMSPEQCQCRPLDPRSDVFAIGIVLYELTTCVKLFTGDSDFEIMKQIVEQPVPPPSWRKLDYPHALEHIVLTALAHNREDRYSSSEALQLALEAFAREHRLAISPVTLSRFMQQMFGPKIQAWREAQQEGKALGDHLANTLTISVTDPSRAVGAGGFGAPGREPALASAGPPTRVPAAPAPLQPDLGKPSGRRRIWMAVLGGIAGLAAAGALGLWPAWQEHVHRRLLQSEDDQAAGPPVTPVIEQLRAPPLPASAPDAQAPAAPAQKAEPKPQPAGAANKRKKPVPSRTPALRPAPKPVAPPPRPAQPSRTPVWDPDSPLPPPP